MKTPQASRGLWALVLGSSLMLGACGGGGDGSSAPPALPNAFKDVLAAAGFDWATSQAIAPALTLRRADGAALGEGWKLALADAACSDPVLGDFETPVATTLYLTQSLPTDTAALTQARVEPGAWQLPAGKDQVLVEVYRDNSVYYSRRHAVGELAALTLALPSAPPSSADAADRAYLDLCR